MMPSRWGLLVAVAAASALGVACDDDDSGSGAAVDDATTVSTPTDASTAASTTAASTTVATPGSEAPAGSAPAPEGVVYTSPEGDYTVVFPSEPTEQTQPQSLPDGSTMDLVVVGVETDDRFMGTARGEFPEGTVLDIPAALQGAQDQAIANVNGTLIASQDVELAGLPGREFSASIESGGETGTVLQRVYFDGPIIYQVIVTGAGEFGFDDPDVAPFFESFQIVDG